MSESFQHKKSLGQHFLNSPVVPRLLADAGEVQRGDIVVEIGPGTGALTEELLARGATVHALETDHRALATLEERFASECKTEQLVLHDVDVRELDLSTLPITTGEFKIVANIPYYLSGKLFRSCLSDAAQPGLLVFLVQKEVAKRITEPQRGGKQSILALSVSVFGEPRYVRSISKNHFTPPPKVDSAIIAVSDISQNAFKELNQAFFFELLHLGFGQRRKQLRKNLGVRFSPETLTAVWEQLELIPTVRAEDVDKETWLRLAELLQEHAS